MLINMLPCGSTLEEQLSSIMDVGLLAKAAVSEISQLFSDGSATLQLQITEPRGKRSTEDEDEGAGGSCFLCGFISCNFISNLYLHS